MTIFLLIPWLIGAFIVYQTALFIARYPELFMKILGIFFVLWILTAFVGMFQQPRITWKDLKTFGITYSLGFLVVFWIASGLAKWSDTEGSYQEKIDDEVVPYFWGEVIETVEGEPILLRLSAPQWNNPYERVGRMGYAGRVNDWEKVHCQQCNHATEQRRAGKNTYVCYDCANINYYE
jgi:hypothetical protein